jgi:hypothetical protein
MELIRPKKCEKKMRIRMQKEGEKEVEENGEKSDEGLSPDGETAKENEIEALKSGKDVSLEDEEDKDADQDVEDFEEAKVRAKIAPKAPTKQERLDHDATHLPYRSWCKHCVRGRGRNTPHRAAKDEKEENQVCKVSMDYFFLGQKDEEAGRNPLIVMLEEETGNRYARAVPQKGLGESNEMEWLIKDMHEELKNWGHPGGAGNALIMKSDGECAIKVVREALSRYHG